MSTQYSDQDIKELDEFARSVIYVYGEEVEPRHLYLKESKEPYRQYLAEVVSNLSGMQHDPRLFFESDLLMRRQWGDQIASDLARYKASEIKESVTASTEPDAVAQMRGELETIKAQLAALTPATPPTATEPANNDTDEES